MKVKNTALRLAGAAMIAVALAPWVGGSSASATAPAIYNAMVKQDQVPVTAANFGSKATDCPNWTAGGSTDSFHFVADAQLIFVSITVEFSTGTVTAAPNDKHAYISAPAGATLVNAWATLSPAPAEGPAADFQLSHVCVGTPVTTTTPPTTPATVTTTPATVTTTPATVTTTPATVTTTPASVLATTAKASPAVSVKGTKAGTVKAVLPHTGSGVKVSLLLATSLALLLGGGAMMMLPGLAPARGKRRRH
jgi:hypothetical protein